MVVEFVMIVVLFFFLLFVMLEVVMVFFIGIVFENVVLEIVCQICMGQVQMGGMICEIFMDEICDCIVVIGNCDCLLLDVQVFEDFGDVDQFSLVQEDGLLDIVGFGWDLGDVGDIVLVCVFYCWLLMILFFGIGMVNMENNQCLIIFVIVF